MFDGILFQSVTQRLKNENFKVFCTCLLRSYIKITVPTRQIILYICTKQINFLHNSSEGHFRTLSLSRYSFSDSKMRRVARLCIDSILLMYFTKYGFQTKVLVVIYCWWEFVRQPVLMMIWILGSRLRCRTLDFPCLVPRPHCYARPMRFGSRGPRKFLSGLLYIMLLLPH